MQERSNINICDDSDTEVSPCIECPRHLGGIDKNKCVKTCEKLAAYRDGKPHTGLGMGELEEIEEEKFLKI